MPRFIRDQKPAAAPSARDARLLVSVGRRPSIERRGDHIGAGRQGSRG